MSLLETGHPDFQDYAQWRGPFLINTAWTCNNASPFTAEQIVTNFASVYLSITQTSGTGVTVFCQFYSDSSFTFLVGQKAWILNPNLPLNVMVPAMGNYCKLVIQTSQAAAAGGTVLFAPTNIIIGKVTYPQLTLTKEANNQTVGAGVTMPFPVIGIQEGPGILYVNPRTGGSTQVITLDSLNEAGNVQYHIVQFPAITVPTTINFIATPTPMVINIDNTGAGAANYDINCTCYSP